MSRMLTVLTPVHQQRNNIITKRKSGQRVVPTYTERHTFNKFVMFLAIVHIELASCSVVGRRSSWSTLVGTSVSQRTVFVRIRQYIELQSGGKLSDDYYRQ